MTMDSTNNFSHNTDFTEETSFKHLIVFETFNEENEIELLKTTFTILVVILKRHYRKLH